MLRYSLGSLFLALLYLSIGCAALVNASGVLPQVAITLTLAILVLFSLGAIFWTERRRVFAIGFSATSGSGIRVRSRLCSANPRSMPSVTSNYTGSSKNFEGSVSASRRPESGRTRLGFIHCWHVDTMFTAASTSTSLVRRRVVR